MIQLVLAGIAVPGSVLANLAEVCNLETTITVSTVGKEYFFSAFHFLRTYIKLKVIQTFPLFFFNGKQESLLTEDKCKALLIRYSLKPPPYYRHILETLVPVSPYAPCHMCYHPFR